ncbi:MAG TPA: VOC family protein [Xanthomonadaceae bacterium]|nr:VOC family protein [Xanthomonadaceae bacterium]
MARSLSTFLMFQDGNAEAAMQRYASLFQDAKIGSVQRWAAGEPGAEGKVKVAEFELAGHRLMCSDSPVKHAFDFTPSTSLFIECADAGEFERLYAALAEGGKTLMPPDDYGFSQRFAWCNDRYGVSWQINLARS